MAAFQEKVALHFLVENLLQTRKRGFTFTPSCALSLKIYLNRPVLVDEILQRTLDVKEVAICAFLDVPESYLAF